MSIVQSPENRIEFKQLIQQNKHKIIIVKASAKWCGPCNASSMYVIDEFNNTHTTNKLLINVNIDKQSDVATFLKIRKIPTLISYKDGYPDQVIQSAEKNVIRSFFTKAFV